MSTARVGAVAGRLVLERFADVSAANGTVVLYSSKLVAVEEAEVVNAVVPGTTAVVAQVVSTGVVGGSVVPNAVVVRVTNGVTGAAVAGTVQVSLLLRGTG